VAKICRPPKGRQGRWHHPVRGSRLARSLEKAPQGAPRARSIRLWPGSSSASVGRSSTEGAARLLESWRGTGITLPVASDRFGRRSLTWPLNVGLLPTKMVYVVKVRYQFLSLRQIGPMPGILRANSRANHLSSGLPIGRAGLFFSKRPVISEALDSVRSVRFSKFERLELIKNFSGKRFCRFSPTTG
jgi:hypothetical protein